MLFLGGKRQKSKANIFDTSQNSSLSILMIFLSHGALLFTNESNYSCILNIESTV